MLNARVNPQGFTFYFDGELPADAIEERVGRWYIKMGFAGFNSTANNRNGYKSRVAALAAIHHYQTRK